MSNRGIAQRVRVPEVMDDPNLDHRRHAGALAGLARLNAVSGSARILWSPIARLARELRVDTLRVLDVATGGGDVPRAVWRRAARAGLRLEIRGLDASPQALDFARDEAKACGAPIEFAQQDALAEELPAGFDVVMSSLFLHHLGQGDAVRLLTKMRRAAGHLVLVNDLRRCRSGLLLAHAAARLLTRSDVVHVDAPRSVRAAFTIEEMRRLSAEAGLHSAIVRPRWPCRFLLMWHPGDPRTDP